MEFLIVASIAFFALFSVIKYINNQAGLSVGKKQKCPYCHEYGLHPGKYGGYYKNGKRTSEWICPRCNVGFEL